MSDTIGTGGGGSHYFAPQPEAPSERHVIEAQVGDLRLEFVVDRQVFSARRLDPGTTLLLENLGEVEGKSVLDMGCGWGPIGLTCLRLGARSAVMVDVNSRALECARETAGLWRVSPDMRQGNGFQTIGATERFDLIATNPPVRAGKDVYYPWVAEAGLHLARGGRFLAVIRVRQGAASLEEELKGHFRRVRRLSRHAGYRVLEASEPSGVLESPS